MPGVILEPLAGCIKWLPRKDDLVPIDYAIDEGCCHHPVVILSTIPRNDRVEILIITSFGGLDLERKYPNQPSARHDHLPIAPSKAHPDNGILLVLKDPSCELRKRSYVKTRDKHSILLASLQPYNRQGPEIFLSKRSYKTLIKRIQFSESADVPLSYALAGGRTLSNSSREHDLERSLGIERSGTAEDVEFLRNPLRRTADDNRTSSLYLSSQTPRSYSVAHTPSPIASRAERQPLFRSREEYHPRRYGYGRRITTLPTTHPIQSDYGNDTVKPFDWKKFRKYTKIVMSICLALLISYGFYRGGSWAVAACGRVLDWIKKAFQSIGGKAKSLWFSCWRRLGLEMMAY
ncbi:hypothetical protein F4823DRAFT_568769 [Ustulina deusta]|nr:hypothetical protein F4823DRAFT_568769 [Ustulina deusta]